MPGAPDQITCVDCGETAHLLDVRGAPGAERVAVYRCSGCMDRWDVVVEEEAEADTGPVVGPGAPTVEGEVDHRSGVQGGTG